MGGGRAAPKVGIPQALTYHYRSTRILERFLREVGAEVIRSPKTTPEIHAAATTLGSADFCLSLRMLVGHVQYLVTQHPDLDFLLVPRLSSEDGERTTTCSKYRDAGGVALRSLTTVVDYLMQHSPSRAALAAKPVLRPDTTPAGRGQPFPLLLQPYVWSLDREPMFNVCFGLYCDVFGLPAAARVGELLAPDRLRRVLAPHVERCLAPFAKAYGAVMARGTSRLDRVLADPRAVRLALVGREYLVGEPLLTADLKPWFMKAGARVITPADVPPEDLDPGPEASMAFYDTHRHFDAFVEHVAPHVDGFIFAGSFGCHPDAFILDLLLDRVRRRGVPAWLFRYDEIAGGAGFQTRYETVMRFLEQRRDRRISGVPAAHTATTEAPGPRQVSLEPPRAPARRLPLITWPYMSDHVQLIMGELMAQAGLSPYALPPRPATDTALALGADTFTESCCPYAFSTGSLVETLEAYFQANPDGPPRRILILMARGEGPCSFGLYVLGQARDLEASFGDLLRKGGHTLEFVSIGLSDVITLTRELAELGDRERLAPIAEYVRMLADGTLGRLPAWRRLLSARRVWQMVDRLLVPVRTKLEALEAVRARALIVRAHEEERGAATEAYRRGVSSLAAAHTVPDVRRVRDRALADLNAIARDGAIRPRVGVVGEIYVMQASFANRGVIDNLLARHGLEVHEGTTLSSLIETCERYIRQRAWIGVWPLRPIVRALWRRNLLVFQQVTCGLKARPFMNVQVGGEGHLSVAHARRLLEAGVDGIVHLMPFKCMPESIAKAPMAEMCRLFGAQYLPLSFNRELEIERIKTEIATFAALLHGRVGRRCAAGDQSRGTDTAREIARRRQVGRAVDALDHAYRRGRCSVA